MASKIIKLWNKDGDCITVESDHPNIEKYRAGWPLDKEPKKAGEKEKAGEEKQK